MVHDGFWFMNGLYWKWIYRIMFVFEMYHGLWSMVVLKMNVIGKLELQWFMDENWNFVTWNCNDLNGYGISKNLNWMYDYKCIELI